MMLAGAEAADLLAALGCSLSQQKGIPSPIDGSLMPGLPAFGATELDAAIGRAAETFAAWRDVPAPVRGELVRRFGEILRANKEPLGRLVTLETGKPLSEGLGEVQEMIDICDFAVGLSRQLYGLTIASERPNHHMREMWHPFGPVGIISAFNFPVAVWAWNASLALVCGNPVLWKPSEKALLSAFAAEQLLQQVIAGFPPAPPGLSALIAGGAALGEGLVADRRLALISATGSTAMGRAVGTAVAARFGRSLLELGGNAATIVAPSADLDLAVRAIAFGATGTSGQRCTSLRRLIVHDAVYDQLLSRLKGAYASFTVGDPRDGKTLIGPLIDTRALQSMQEALAQARVAGGIVCGGEQLGDLYVNPAIVEMPRQAEIVRQETFAPILFVLRYREFGDAINLLRDVPQGLSSSILTTDLREAEAFLSASGSDCGIANINMGTSGAEIGGAFGGEKETGGGRESGSDAWKSYMRRQTQNINYGRDLPLAQGVTFDL
jgi:aldehyde dehydrogenase (NAD+)